MRTVSWRNIWNWTAKADGYGSRTHLTESEGPSGKTLCGREFPAERGHSSSWHFCRRCLNKAYAQGYPKGFTRDLEAL